MPKALNMVKERMALSLQTLLALANSAALPALSCAGSTARVDFSIGDVTASTPDGARPSLIKGGKVSEGELITTNKDARNFASRMAPTRHCSRKPSSRSTNSR